MSPVTGTIAAVRRGTKPDKHGNNVYLLDIPEHNIKGGYLAAKTFEPKQGEQITVEVRQGQYGPMLKRITEQNSSGGGQSSGQRSQGRPSDPERERRIVRQHSQEMAVRYAPLVNALQGLNTPADPRVTPPESFRQLIDWFEQDAFGNSARPGAAPPPTSADGSTAKGADNGAQTSDTAESVQAGQTLTDDDGIPF